MKTKVSARGLWVALAAFVCDRATKALVLRLDPEQELALPGLRICAISNTGAAFSLFRGNNVLLAAFTALLIAGMTVLLLAGRVRGKLTRAGLWLCAGGGLGNLVDRLRYGSVIDFIEPTFVRFSVFNVADALIVLGAALIAASCLFVRGEEAA